MKIIMFTGHRDKLCDKCLFEKLPHDALWIHGGAVGFDTQVQEYALDNNISTVVLRPNYTKYGNKAPLVRNDEMLEVCDEVVAFYDGRKSGGTFYVVQKAKKLGKKITYFDRIEQDENN